MILVGISFIVVVCMNYCISFMQDGKELLKKEILQEIGKIKKEKENKLFGEESIRESIEHYERKKRKSGLPFFIERLLCVS